MQYDEKWLKAAYASLPPLEDEEPEPYTWAQHRLAFRTHVAEHDINHMLRWSTISGTMFAGETPFIRSELEALRAQGEWRERWLPAVTDSSVGTPPLMHNEPRINANMVHQAYHLMLWEKATLVDIRELETITEFGGGYGAMALIISRLGFRGTYNLVDFAELCLLQTYYLAQHSLGCGVQWFASEPAPTGADLFIACYSLSEVGLEARAHFLDTEAGTYLITMQEQWDEIDNVEWFRGVEASLDKRWTLFPMVRPGHWYAIGGLAR